MVRFWAADRISVVTVLLIPFTDPRIVRSQTPRISAASSQVIFFPLLFKITSCTFVIRSSSAVDFARLVSNRKRLLPLFQKRTDTVLLSTIVACPKYGVANALANLNGQFACQRQRHGYDTVRYDGVVMT
jgi:hypothetical protein